MRKKLLVADDHAVVRMGLVALLESEKDIEVVGEAGDGDTAVSAARKTAPDIRQPRPFPGKERSDSFRSNRVFPQG